MAYERMASEKFVMREIAARMATGSFTVVESLPASGVARNVYLVPKAGGGAERNVYDEYVYAGGAWEKIGDTEIDLSGYKTRQAAVSDPEASGDALEFVASLSQDENGVVSATKKSVKAAVAPVAGAGGSAGLMSAADKAKLDGVQEGAQANVKPDWNAEQGAAAEILNKPSSMAPTAHSHAVSETWLVDVLADVRAGLPYALVPKTPVNGSVTLSDRAVNLVSPTATELPPVWEWSDGQDHGQPAYGVIEDYGDYQEYGWGFSGEGGTLSHYDSFGNYYDFVYDSDDATELSFYSYDTDTTIVASLVTPYETDVASLAFPPAITGKVRDFMVRLAMPEHATMFSWPSGVDFETEDGQMPDVSEPGVYLLAFTETGAGRFALLCRKVQGVS